MSYLSLLTYILWLDWLFCSQPWRCWAFILCLDVILLLKLIPSDCLGVPRLLRGDKEADRHDAHSAEDAAGPVRVCGGDDCGLCADVWQPPVNITNPNPWYTRWDCLNVISLVNFYLCYIFSSPEPKAQVSYCHSAPSVVRKLSHFWLLLWNRLTEFNETWQEAISQRPLPSLCFSGRSEKQDGRPGLWLLRHFLLFLWNCWTEFNETWQEARSQSPLQSLFFFGPIGKLRWLPWPLIGWDIFDFSSETTELNLTKLDRKQDLKALYWVCVYWADWKNKMAARASDWLRHFRLLLWNRWIEFNETWQEVRSKRPLPNLCFSGRSEK